jgi:dipeptidyl aminopeptidase/acylaminoacyl peptidase
MNQELEAAHRRAMPIQRLLDNGMEYADAVALHRLTGEGRPWIETAEGLGDRDLERAQEALKAGRQATARSYFRHASACYRFAQSPIAVDDERKLGLYRKLMAAFAQACALDVPPSVKIEVPFRGKRMSHWLLRPAGAARPPLVMIFGGADGWRETYWLGGSYLLERGIAVLLMDGPGQGETRLFNGLYLEADSHLAFSATREFLAEQKIARRIGIWGNSMGGYFAARAAAADPGFAACCVNGGSPRPAEVLDRFPRFVEKLRAMTGTPDPLPVVSRLDLGDSLRTLHCPLLQLHGAPDQIFLLENARRIHDAAASADKQLRIWDDGDHCIYNHAHEKHTLVGDWFAERLAG